MPVWVLAAPGIPHQFYGTVDFANGSAPDGVLIEAKINNNIVATTETKDGKYGYDSIFYVTDPDSNRAGKTITFFVQGIDTGKSATFINGEHTEIDFSISGNIGEISKSEDETIENQPVVITPTMPTIIKMGDKLEITISSQTNATATIEKIEKLASGNVAVFSGKNLLNAFEIKIRGENLSISVTMTYDDSDIDEDTIVPYWFDGTSWVEITPFTVDKSVANTLTFSISSAETPYALFGSPPAPSPPPSDNGGDTGGGGSGGGGGATDTTAPSISDINVTAGSNAASITWKTNESSISWIVYGTSTDYGQEAKTTSYTASHSVTLNDLSPGATYHYQIKSKDNSGNIRTGDDRTFTTLAEGEKITGDINDDAKIDKYDFALMMSDWGKTGVNDSDLNGDNKVDKYDFALLMLNWSAI